MSNNQHPLAETPNSIVRNTLQGIWGHLELSDGQHMLLVRSHTLETWARQLTRVVMMLEAANDPELPPAPVEVDAPLPLAKGCLWGLVVLLLLTLVLGLWLWHHC